MSPAALDIVLLEPHEAALRLLLQRENGAEASAYVLFGKADISADPWSGVPRTRLISHEVIPVAADEMVSASPVHVTWSTEASCAFSASRKNGLGCGMYTASERGSVLLQDDRNESELARTTFNKGVSGLASMVFGRDDAIAGRLWTAPARRSWHPRSRW